MHEQGQARVDFAAPFLLVRRRSASVRQVSPGTRAPSANNGGNTRPNQVKPGRAMQVHKHPFQPNPTQSERPPHSPLAARRERTCGLPRGRRRHLQLLRTRRRRRRRWKATLGPTSSSLSGPSTAGTCDPLGSAWRSSRRTPPSRTSCVRFCDVCA